MILDRFRLDDQVALITGGTRGIGLGIAEAFLQAGAKVIVSSKTPNPTALAHLTGLGFSVDYIAADMEQPDAPDALIVETLKRFGRLDILVNNAGVADHGDTTEFSDARYERLMDINLGSVFRASRAALRPMRQQGAGVILNIGSISGLVSNIPQRQAAYNASKAAVHMLTKSLASDYAAENIRVNAIAPGYIRTDMTAGGLDDPAMSAVWKEMTPLPFVGDPADIATAALYLCSRASRYVTGEVLVVDGGYTIR
jgi:NAD(P)-dependent dehydrogenase (short-subunit alcohol dehydrogenase family)